MTAMRVAAPFFVALLLAGCGSDTELVAIEGAGHFVWDEQPERCAGALTAFLGRLG